MKGKTSIILPAEILAEARAKVDRRKQEPGGSGYSLSAYLSELLAKDIAREARRLKSSGKNGKP